MSVYSEMISRAMPEGLSADTQAVWLNRYFQRCDDDATNSAARIATLEAQLKAQRANVAADDVLLQLLARRLPVNDRRTSEAVAFNSDWKAAITSCSDTREAAKLIDKETPDAQ